MSEYGEVASGPGSTCELSSGVALKRQSTGSISPELARSSANNSLVTPISTLYASPANSSSVAFCAFQPNRVMVPSLPLRLGRPEIRNACLALALTARLSRIVLSETLSIKPPPNTGVGIRNEMLFWRRAWSKSGCDRRHVCTAPVAPCTLVASTRPVTVKRSCTPPSGLLVTSPLRPTNGKAVVLGLVPPTAGCEWQLLQLFELNLGPRPSCGWFGRPPFIERAVAKVASPSANVFDCPALRPDSGPPASIDPARTPGSTACACRPMEPQASPSNKTRRTEPATRACGAVCMHESAMTPPP